jgi:F-type H+-transporting ATPase subunit delta
VLKAADRPVAGRYARALFQAADHAKTVDAVRRDLDRLTEVMAAVPSLANALFHPRVPAAAKGDLVTLALGTLSPITDRFLRLLIEKKRLDALVDIARRFVLLADAARGVVAVETSTAVPLTEAQRRALEKTLRQVFGDVVISARTEPSLLGGVVVRVGDQLWDGSVAGQLARLKENLLMSRN